MDVELATLPASDTSYDLTALGPGDPEVDIDIMRCIPKAFAIDSEESANWLVRKIVAAREYAQHVKAWSEQEQHRAAREEKTLMFLFGRHLAVWAKDAIARLSGKRKSVCLPAGTVGFRKAAAKLVVDDERIVLAWCKENCPGAIVVTEKLAKIVLDQHVHSTGHAPENGVHVEPEAEKFFIR